MCCKKSGCVWSKNSAISIFCLFQVSVWWFYSCSWFFGNVLFKIIQIINIVVFWILSCFSLSCLDFLIVFFVQLFCSCCNLHSGFVVSFVWVLLDWKMHCFKRRKTNRIIIVKVEVLMCAIGNPTDRYPLGHCLQLIDDATQFPLRLIMRQIDNDFVEKMPIIRFNDAPGRDHILNVGLV